MGILDSNPAEAGTVQTDSATNLDDKSVAELFAMEEEADEANPKPVASEAPEKPGKQAEDEPEPEGEEPESEEEPTAEESDDQKDEPDAKADSDAIEIDGKRWTRDELKASLMMQADYTRKTQEIASQRREMDTAIERLTKQDERAKADIGFAMAVLQELNKAPDRSLIDTDPQGWLKAVDAHQTANQVLQHLRSQYDAYNQQQQAQLSEQSARALQNEWQVAVQKLPELAAPEGRTKFREDAIRFGKEAWGLEPSEIDGIESAKALLVLKDAIEFRKLKANAPKAVQTVKAAPKIARPGTREQPAATPLARLQKLGSDPKASVADIFAAMEED